MDGSCTGSHASACCSREKSQDNPMCSTCTAAPMIQRLFPMPNSECRQAPVDRLGTGCALGTYMSSIECDHFGTVITDWIISN
jgi:hypothetical protein